jgi:4-aminobutyrate aminotransferase
MNKLRTLCDDNGILLVSDEIQQGLGRTGKWFCIENFGVEADLYVLGKSVGGGLPLGIVIGNEEVIESLQTPAHTFSMIGNSAVSVAALKNLEITKRLDINSKSVELGEYTKQAFERLQSKYELIGDVRGIGLSIGVDLVKDRTTREKNYDAAAKICNRCMDKGLILIFIGRSTLRIQPPLVITKEQIDQGIAIIEEAIIEYENGEIGDEVFDHIKGWD